MLIILLMISNNQTCKDLGYHTNRYGFDQRNIHPLMDPMHSILQTHIPFSNFHCSFMWLEGFLDIQSIHGKAHRFLNMLKIKKARLVYPKLTLVHPIKKLM